MKNLIDDRWTIDVNERLGYISVNDHKKKVALFSDGEDATKLLEKCEELGENTDFIDWLYNNEYDIAMNETNYHNR